jgi:hypothetical protein
MQVMLKNEYEMITPAQLLRRWSDQRPSNKGYLDPSVSGEVGGVYYTGLDEFPI